MKIDRYKLDVIMGDRGMTLGELADAAGMTRQNLTTVLSATKNSQPKSIGRIAQAMGVSVADITAPE